MSENKDLFVRSYCPEELEAMIDIWNKVVEDGIAFPQEELLNKESGASFFAEQSHCGVAECGGEIVGLYILHPNNIGRCGHIANASFAVLKSKRGQNIGEALVKDCLKMTKKLGFKILQFNAVVKTNTAARKLYEKLGFKPLGIIPHGFKMKDGHFEDICPYYFEV